MARRKQRSSKAKPVTMAVFRRFQAETTSAIDDLKRECATNLRRCAELQRDLDDVRKRFRG